MIDRIPVFHAVDEALKFSFNTYLVDCTCDTYSVQSTGTLHDFSTGLVSRAKRSQLLSHLRYVTQVGM